MQCPQCHYDSPTDLVRCPKCGVKVGAPAPGSPVTVPGAIAQRLPVLNAEGQTLGNRVLLTPLEIQE
jgi:hypothetical protein